MRGGHPGEHRCHHRRRARRRHEARHGAHEECAGEPARSAERGGPRRDTLRKAKWYDVYHGQRGEHEHVGHREVEPRIGADAAEQRAGEPREDAKRRVDHREPDDVREREQHRAEARRALRAGQLARRLSADDRRGDRDHGVHAGGKAGEHAASVITRDGRKMIIGTQPVRFLMQPVTDTNRLNNYEPDAIDFNSFFANQGSKNIRVLSALRMNATFPYVLPNVWLPTNPIIDVMDAGLRDNFGQESTLRFIETFKDWLQANTSSVVIIQLRDRAVDDWDKPLDGNSITSFFTKPFLLLQNNWFKMQDYYQHDAIEYLHRSYGSTFKRVSFQYIPTKEAARASLSFHLTSSEKKDIAASLNDSINMAALQQLKKIIHQ